MSRTRTVSITSTNGHTRVTVPTGYSPTVNIDLAGAGGGAGGRYYGANGAGGNGALLSGSLALNPGDVLDVYIGGGGSAGGANATNSNAGGSGGGSAMIGTVSGQTTVYPVSLSYAWSQFMNDYAVWVNPDGVNPVNVTNTITRYVDVSVAGTYTFQAECDNYLNLYIDGVNIINTADFQSYYAASAGYYLNPGRHTIQMDVTNWGGPAGVAVVLYDPYGSQIWNTRSVLNPDNLSYWFRGGNGGNTYGDGGYVYPAPGGGGGASVVFLNGSLLLVAGGGGGGGSEGGHGAGGTSGGDGGTGGGSPYGTQGQPGSDGGDIAGTPGGGGGYQGGAAGSFVYYDDAPSLGANGGTNYNALNVTYTAGSGVYTVPSGVTQLTVTLVGGGGGGGGCGGNEEPVYTGGGGAGGATTYAVIDVTPGQQIPWTVGSGGAGGNVGSAGLAGLSTTLGGLSASGGYGGGIPGGANNGVYVGDEYSASGGAGGYPNGGAGGGYDEDAEVGNTGASGGNGSVNIQIGNWYYSTYAGSGNLGNGLSGYCNITFTELGSGKVKVAGQWKQIIGNWVKVGGQWKQVVNAYTKVNGVWKVVSGGTPVPTAFTPSNYG